MSEARCGCGAGHVIPGLIHKCYLAQKAGEPFTIMGTGKPLCAPTLPHLRTAPATYQEATKYQCSSKKCITQSDRKFLPS